MCIRDRNYMAYLRSLHVCVVYTTQDLSQIQRTQGGKEFNQRTVPVSYTHLDVYKRQGWQIDIDGRRITVDCVLREITVGNGEIINY